MAASAVLHDRKGAGMYGLFPSRAITWLRTNAERRENRTGDSGFVRQTRTIRNDSRMERCEGKREFLFLFSCGVIVKKNGVRAMVCGTP